MTCGETIDFPDKWEDFMERYEIIDKEQVYTNGITLVSAYRIEDMVNHYFMPNERAEVESPQHYRGNGKVECKDAMCSMMSPVELNSDTSYWWGCAFKYLWRWPLKNGRKDLLKAKQCIDYLLDSL